MLGHYRNCHLCIWETEEQQRGPFSPCGATQGSQDAGGLVAVFSSQIHFTGQWKTQQFSHPQDFSTAALCLNCTKAFISKAARSGELAWLEGEPGQLGLQPRLQVILQMVAGLCRLKNLQFKSRAGATRVYPTEDLTQGYLSDLNCVFRHYVDYLTREDKKNVFSLSNGKYDACLGILLLSISTLGVNILELKNKIFESKGSAMLACEQMGIGYPSVKFRLKTGRSSQQQRQLGQSRAVETGQSGPGTVF